MQFALPKKFFLFGGPQNAHLHTQQHHTPTTAFSFVRSLLCLKYPKQFSQNLYVHPLTILVLWVRIYDFHVSKCVKKTIPLFTKPLKASFLVKRNPFSVCCYLVLIQVFVHTSEDMASNSKVTDFRSQHMVA
jgi:hypothetical protein